MEEKSSIESYLNSNPPVYINIFEEILKNIGLIADREGFKVFVVGGYVRDKFLNRSRNDFDLSVVGNAVEFAEMLAKEYHTKTVVYPKFGTAMLPIGDYKIEIVGTRKEVYRPDSRNPYVEPATFEDDLRRRDFTINAMAAELNPTHFGRLIDIFGGIEDLGKCILRTPLEPTVTFNDDPLRMLRAARFASELDFDIESVCFESISKLAHRIEIISQERISDEFLKIISSPHPSKGLFILFKTGLLKIVFPELHNLAGVEIVQEGSYEFGHKDVFRHTLKVLDNISKMTDNTWLRFAALVHDIAKPRTKRYVDGQGWTFHGHEEIGARWMGKIFRRMKFPLEHLSYIEKLVRLHQRPMALVDEEVTDSAIRRLAYNAGDALEDLFTLCRADITTKNPNLSRKYLENYEKVTQKVIEVQEKDRLREFQSPVRGEEIMEMCGLEPSKAVGYIKSSIEEAILDGIIPNEYDAAKSYMIQNLDDWMNEIQNKSLHIQRRKN